MSDLLNRLRDTGQDVDLMTPDALRHEVRRLRAQQSTVHNTGFDDTRRVYEQAELDAAVGAAREECAATCAELDGWRAWKGIEGFEGAPMEAAAAAGYLADKIRGLKLTGALDRAIAQARFAEANEMWELRCLGDVLGDEAMKGRIAELERAARE